MPSSNKPLKIGFVFDDSLDKPDGVQQYILSLGGWLTLQGHEVHYLVGQTLRTDIANVHSLSRNIKVSFNGNGMSIPAISSSKRLKSLLRSEQFDVLHVQVPYSPFLAGKIMRFAGPQTAVIGSFHIAPNSWLVSAATRLLGIWTQRANKRFDAFLSVSSAAQSLARSAFGITSEISPNVFDYPRFANAKPIAVYDDGRPTILFLGRLVERKGCATLLEALQILHQRRPELRFHALICGKGPLQPQLIAYVKEHQLDDYVTFTGFVDEVDKPGLYASADISVFPSNGGESFGIVLIEAMASSQAIVLGGDNSGYRSVLEPQEALLFAPRNSTLLADKLEHYLDYPDERKALAVWGSKYAKQFDVDVVGHEMLKIYKTALHKRRLP